MQTIWVNSYETKKGIRWGYKIEIPGTDGKRKFINKSGFPKRKMAYEEGQKALTQYMSTGHVKTTSISFGDFAKQWIEEDASKRCKESTIIGYRKKIKNLLNPTLANYLIKDIDLPMLRDLLYELYNQGYSYNTLDAVRGLLRAIFGYATSLNLIPYSPANDLKKIKSVGKAPKRKTRTRPHSFITEEEIDKIFKRFPEGHPSHLPLMLAYHCGLRSGEIYALTWEDIDLENKTLTVNRQVEWHEDLSRSTEEKILANGTTEAGKGYWYFTEPKERSFRTIEIDDELLGLLQRTKERSHVSQVYAGPSYQRYYSEHKLIYDAKVENPIEPDNKIVQYNTGNEIHFILRREDGSYISERTKQHTSYVIQKKLNVQNFTMHSLRHTHATMLRDAGCPEIYIAKRIGHKKVETTVQVYMNHLTDSVLDKGNSILKQMF